jgi:outer membrane receptor for ferrienterochelin and colicin
MSTVSTVQHRALIILASTTMLVAGACHRATARQPSLPEKTTRSFPGVDLVPTNSGFVVRVRSGMAGHGEPLYVIDGAPTKVDANRGIDWFPPEAIADIKVLKAPYELMEYGPSGANGVVVITTKRSPQHPR